MQIDSNDLEPTVAVHFLAAFLSGAFCCFIFYPLEHIEARLQVDSSKKYHGFVHAFQTIRYTQGFLALYKGLLPSLLNAAFGASIYFALYEFFKQQFLATLSCSVVLIHILAAICSWIISSILVNPLLVLKMRAITSVKQRDIFQVLLETLQTDGIISFWSGLVPSLLGVTEGAIQISLYEHLIGEFVGAMPSWLAYGMSGMVSKAAAIVATYPYQFVRARMQVPNCSHTGVMGCIATTYQEEGYLAFYTGMQSNIARQLIPTALFFYLMESFKSLIQLMLTSIVRPEATL